MHFGTPKKAHMFSQGSGPGLYESKTYYFKSEKTYYFGFCLSYTISQSLYGLSEMARTWYAFLVFMSCCVRSSQSSLEKSMDFI